MQPRSAAAAGRDFPYTSRTTCYIEISEDGTVSHGIIHDQDRTGLAEHEHLVRWKLSPYETKPNASYVDIELELDCGCTIEDLRTFADQMRTQRGWDIATSCGWGRSSRPGHNTTYSLRARRKSLSSPG
ncbi:hypothetical protein [Kitasatospora sp. NPDC004531]